MNDPRPPISGMVTRLVRLDLDARRVRRRDCVAGHGGVRGGKEGDSMNNEVVIYEDDDSRYTADIGDSGLLTITSWFKGSKGDWVVDFDAGVCMPAESIPRLFEMLQTRGGK